MFWESCAIIKGSAKLIFDAFTLALQIIKFSQTFLPVFSPITLWGLHPNCYPKKFNNFSVNSCFRCSRLQILQSFHLKRTISKEKNITTLNLWMHSRKIVRSHFLDLWWIQALKNEKTLEIVHFEILYRAQKYWFDFIGIFAKETHRWLNLS